MIVVVVACCGLVFLFGNLGHERVGGEQQRRHAGRVGQRRADHLCRIDHAGFHHIDVPLAIDIVPVRLALHPPHAIDDHGSIQAGVRSDVAQRIVEHVADDIDAELFVAFQLEAVECFFGADQRDAAAGHDTFLQGRPGGGLGIFQQGLPLLHLGLGGRTAIDLSDAPGQFGEAFFELLPIVIAVGGFDFVADLVGPAADGIFLAAAAHDRRVVGGDGNLAGPAQIGELDRFQFDAQVLKDGRPAGQSGDVAQHGFATITIAGRLDGANLENRAKLVDDERRQRFALDVFGDDQQRLGRLGNGFQHGHQVFGAGNLFLVDEHQAVFQLHRLLVRIGDKMRR